jgi:D-alanine-D-alanine ligase
VRIGHAKHLVSRLTSGDRWDLVFNIAEGLRGFGREALVPALLEHWDIPYVFSDPLVCALTLHKAQAKRVLAAEEVPTTPFALVEEEADVERVRLPFPLFAKPVAEGTSKGISRTSKTTSRDELRDVCRDLLARFHQPVLVEPFLAGREFTVGILGTGARARAIGALEVVLRSSADPEIYTYANKEDCEIHVSYEIATDALAKESCELAVTAWRVLGCRDGGRVDLRADSRGRLMVLETNPLPGLHPAHSDLPILATRVGLSYHDLIAGIVSSALERVPTPAVRA